MPNQARFTQNVNNPLLKTVNSTSGLMEFPTSSDRHLDINLASADSGHGLATEAKQDDMITDLGTIAGDTTSIDDKIVKSSDQTPASGTAIECLMYGRDFTYGNLEALRTSSDGKIFVDTSLMTTTNTTLTDGSQVSVIKANDGNDGSGTDRVIKCDGNGALIVDNSADSIITADGTTQEQRVMIHGNYNGNLRTLKCGEGGALATELDHSWDNTNQIFNTEACADGDTITSSTFDLGQGVSHEPDKVQFFLDNSAGVNIEIQGYTSFNGTDFYVSGNAYTINTSEGSVYFSQEDVGIAAGHRYMQLSVTNNDGLGTSTNISCQIGYYK